MIKTALAYGERHELQIDKDFAVIKLFEGVGELAQAVLIHNKNAGNQSACRTMFQKNWPKSWPMSAGLAILNAHLLDIDPQTL